MENGERSGVLVVRRLCHGQSNKGSKKGWTGTLWFALRGGGYRARATGLASTCVLVCTCATVWCATNSAGQASACASVVTAVALGTGKRFIVQS